MTYGPAPIVVGVDGTEASMAALHWAAGEAEAHGAPLIAVHVTDPRGRRGAPYAGRGVYVPTEAQALDEEARVERMIAQSGLEHVKRVFDVGVPSQVLVRFAIGARMLVLGHADNHRRREGEGPYQGPALGSIARACVASATCPVVVVPVPARLPAARERRPEPRHVPVVQHSPMVGARMIYPNRRPVPMAHG
ncbi:universal stress protein [Actinocrinis puniceicyclus]|uniref:Universal stress protein n=1 Tax=Actinocrinis puniceicyclus TaxID=977794 RepID=A0A8J7WKV1_9ACTN|nr:universal stress protein [Actinocrinis puniceicyclus]MBS2964166.1 universal stress protein [Actinocrinis puniceicyclus]